MTEPTSEQKARAWDKLSFRFRVTVFKDPMVRQLIKEIQDEMDKFLKEEMRRDVTCRTCKHRTESNNCEIYPLFGGEELDLDDWCGKRELR